MSRILIVDGHPDPDPAHFVHALASAYEDGAAAASHETRRITIGELDFPLIRNQHEWMNVIAPPVIGQAQRDILWAEHIVFVYPLWLGDVPALLKAFLEQVARPGFAIGPDKTMPKGLLHGRSARVIVTMGMPAFFYALVYRAHSLKSLERNILKFAGISPVRHTLVGAVETGPEYRAKWLERIRRLGRRGD